MKDAAVTNSRIGSRTVLMSPVTPSRLDGRALPFNATHESLNAAYFDVAFTGEPLQCDEGDGTCAAVKRTYRFADLMDTDQANDYKYVFVSFRHLAYILCPVLTCHRVTQDADGNGWCARTTIMLRTLF